MSDEVFDDGDGFGDGGYDWESGYVDSSGIGEGELTSGGGVTVGGKYHFYIQAVTEPKKPHPEQENPNTPSWMFQCEVLEAAYTDEQKTQVGKCLYHRCYVAKKVVKEVGDRSVFAGWAPPAQGSVKSQLRFALGLGLITLEELDNPKLKIPWKNAEGRQFCADITIDKSTNVKTKKESIKAEIPFGEVFAVDDERVADWPKNKDALYKLNMAKGGEGQSSSQDDLGDL